MTTDPTPVTSDEPEMTLAEALEVRDAIVSLLEDMKAEYDAAHERDAA